MANYWGATIVKLTPSGVGTVFAPSAGLLNPDGLAFDADGNLYVSDQQLNCIKKITSQGVVSTFASGLSRPLGLAFDSAGFLYVANANSGTIEKFDSSGVGTLFVTGLSQPRNLAFQPVPEPASWALLTCSLAVLCFLKRGPERSNQRETGHLVL